MRLALSLAPQESAGIDVVCDGELYRFDTNHPDTNGMIEYFARPLAGVRTDITFDELMDYRRSNTGFRGRPPGVVDAAIAAGSLDLPAACDRAQQITNHSFKFTATGPHMLAKTLVDKHYGDLPALSLAISDVLAEQVRHINADVVQLDEATSLEVPMNGNGPRRRSTACSTP